MQNQWGQFSESQLSIEKFLKKLKILEFFWNFSASEAIALPPAEQYWEVIQLKKKIWKILKIFVTDLF